MKPHPPALGATRVKTERAESALACAIFLPRQMPETTYKECFVKSGFMIQR